MITRGWRLCMPPVSCLLICVNVFCLWPRACCALLVQTPLILVVSSAALCRDCVCYAVLTCGMLARRQSQHILPQCPLCALSTQSAEHLCRFAVVQHCDA